VGVRIRVALGRGLGGRTGVLVGWSVRVELGIAVGRLVCVGWSVGSRETPGAPVKPGAPARPGGLAGIEVAAGAVSVHARSKITRQHKIIGLWGMFFPFCTKRIPIHY
jgi:hypothetical protein